MDNTELTIVQFPFLDDLSTAELEGLRQWILMDLPLRQYTSVSPDDVYDWLGGRKSLPVKPILLAFADGGTKTFYEEVAPTLRMMGTKFALYVIPDYIDGLPDPGGTDNPVYPEADPMTWAQVREVAQSGYPFMDYTVDPPVGRIREVATIGVMGRDGAPLTTLVQDPPATEGGDPPPPRLPTFPEIRESLRYALRRVQENINRSVQHLCYPQGVYNMDAAMAAAYECRTAVGRTLYDGYYDFEPTDTVRFETVASPRYRLTSIMWSPGLVLPEPQVPRRTDLIHPLMIPQLWDMDEGWDFITEVDEEPVPIPYFQGAGTEENGTATPAACTFLSKFPIRSHASVYQITAKIKATVSDGAAEIKILEFDKDGEALSGGSVTLRSISTDTDEQVAVMTYRPSALGVVFFTPSFVCTDPGAELQVFSFTMHEV